MVLPAVRRAAAGGRGDRAVRPQLVQPGRRRAGDGLLHRGGVPALPAPVPDLRAAARRGRHPAAQVLVLGERRRAGAALPVPAGRPDAPVEAVADGPGVDHPLGGLLPGQGRDVGAHRHPRGALVRRRERRQAPGPAQHDRPPAVDRAVRRGAAAGAARCRTGRRRPATGARRGSMQTYVPDHAATLPTDGDGRPKKKKKKKTKDRVGRLRSPGPVASPGMGGLAWFNGLPAGGGRAGAAGVQRRAPVRPRGGRRPAVPGRGRGRRRRRGGWRRAWPGPRWARRSPRTRGSASAPPATPPRPPASRREQASVGTAAGRRPGRAGRRQPRVRGALRARLPHPRRRPDAGGDAGRAAPPARPTTRRPSAAEVTGQLAEITRLRVERLVGPVSLSTHVLDATRGRPAAGVAVRLSASDGPLATGETDADGRCALVPGDLPAAGLRAELRHRRLLRRRRREAFYPG